MFNFIRTFPFNPFSNYGIRAASSYVRVFNASPGTRPVDVYANKLLIAKNISYKTFTEYFTLVPGNYKIEIFPTGNIYNPFYVTNISIAQGTIHTLAIIGRVPTLSIVFLLDPVIQIPAGKLYIRLAHYSPTTSNVDVTQSNGTSLFKNVAYKQITNYLLVNPGTYALNTRLTGVAKTILYVPNIHLLAGKFYTLYLVGLKDGTPPLQMLIPLDGNSYIKF
jgi:hypothetical protein